MKRRPFKVANFEKRKKENNLNSPNISNIAKVTLILKDCGIASYPCSNYGPSNLLQSNLCITTTWGRKFLWLL